MTLTIELAAQQLQAVKDSYHKDFFRSDSDESLKQFLITCINTGSNFPSMQHSSNLLGQIILNELSKRQNEQLRNCIGTLSSQIEENNAVSEKQLDAIGKLHGVSQNQLESANAIVEEAKATTRISAVIASLTIVLAIETYYLDIPEIIKMGTFQAIMPLVVLGLCFAYLFWHLNRREKKS